MLRIIVVLGLVLTQAAVGAAFLQSICQAEGRVSIGTSQCSATGPNSLALALILPQEDAHLPPFDSVGMGVHFSGHAQILSPDPQDTASVESRAIIRMNLATPGPVRPGFVDVMVSAAEGPATTLRYRVGDLDVSSGRFPFTLGGPFEISLTFEMSFSIRQSGDTSVVESNHAREFRFFEQDGTTRASVVAIPEPATGAITAGLILLLAKRRSNDRRIT